MAHDLERYAIFRKLPDGSPIWISAESDFEKAMQKMRDLAASDGTEYFLHDFHQGISIPPAVGDTPFAG